MFKSENEVLIEKLKTTTQNLIAYQNENDSLKRENEGLRKVLTERNNTIDRMNSAISAYRESLMIISGQRKR